jgi:hypothetical protein
MQNLIPVFHAAIEQNSINYSQITPFFALARIISIFPNEFAEFGHQISGEISLSSVGQDYILIPSLIAARPQSIEPKNISGNLLSLSISDKQLYAMYALLSGYFCLLLLLLIIFLHSFLILFI